MAQNAATSVLVLGARTDDAAAAVDDASAEEMRLINRILGEGIIDPATAWQVIESSPQAMSVRVGNGTAEDDLAMVVGTASGQENYLVRHEDTYSTITVTASDPSNPRIDEIYLVVHDAPYDSGSTTRADVEYRAGTAAGSPAAPGPAASWKAYLLLARVAVGAGVTVVTNANITDMRTVAQFTADFSAVGDRLAGQNGTFTLYSGGTINPTAVQMLFSAGTFVGNTDGSGDISLTLPVAFVYGILTVQVTNGDSVVHPHVIFSVTSCSLTVLKVRVYDPHAAGPLVSTGPFRFNYLIIGY